MEEKNLEQTRNGRGPGHGPGPGSVQAVGEKVEKGTWGKLVGYCRKYIVVVVIAVLCSAGGTILTLIGPDKLSEMTDVITEGIAPDTDVLEEISINMADNMEENMGKVSEAISENVSANMEKVIEKLTENAGKAMMDQPVSDEEIEVNGVKISAADQLSMMEMLGGIDMEDSQAMLMAMGQLPESVKKAVFTEIEVNGAAISGEDQLVMLELLGTIDMENEEAMTEVLASIPESVRSALYTEITVAGNPVSGKDQQTMVDLLGSVDEEDTDSMLNALDGLPGSIYNLVKPSIDLKRVVQIALTLAFLYVLGAVLSGGQGFIMATVTQKISRSLRDDISKKINRLPMSYYNRHSTGDVLSRVTNDVDTIGMTLNMSVGNLVHSVTQFIGSLVMMLTTNVLMTVTGIAATIIGFVLMMLIMGRSQKYFVRQQKHLGAVNGHIEEIYAGHTVVKAYNGEEKANEQFKELNDKLRDSGFRAQALSGLMMPIMTFIGNFGYVAVCIVGASLALNGKITFGVIVAFMMYIRFFTQPLSQIAQAAQSLQSAGAAASRVFEFLEAEEMEDESGKTNGLTSALGNVTFSHVRFSYPDTPDKVIIKDFSAEAKAGQKIAIVGPTGAGKTTLVNLLMRFYEINGGEIRIDGISTASMKRADVHSQFCMVLQDTWLFEGTVRENLIYCSENASEEKMKKACYEVGLDHFIRTLPQGYDTVLDDSVSLSQGQKQQLTIARAMIADKPILILDEATSSIDTRTEQKIQAAMDELMNGRTSFVIAHRLSTIRNADLILVLKDGDVIESGTHEELMSRNGFYADLYNSQFEQSA